MLAVVEEVRGMVVLDLVVLAVAQVWVIMAVEIAQLGSGLVVEEEMVEVLAVALGLEDKSFLDI
jgi:hypothetical protein